MTPCEELGYKVGDKFVVTQDNHDKYGLSKGDILHLLIDDGTDVPFFSCRDTAVHCALSRIKPYIGDRTMTLLELLVQELPKRGGWPEWAAAAVQDGDHEVKFAGIGSWNIQYTVDNMWRGTWGDLNFFITRMKARFTAPTLASDHATRIVTREEYERAAAIKASEDMVKSAIQRLTDAVTTKSDKVNDTGETITLHFPAGYHVQTPLQRIEQLRKARDEAVRAYNDAFVSGEAELRKLKLGDKIILSTDSGRYDGLIVKLVEISQKRDAIDSSVLYECLFVDSKGNDVRIDKYCDVRFAPL